MLAMILVACGAVLPAEPVQAARVYRVGRIIIEGNDQTPDRVILEQLPARVRPGARLYHRDLAIGAERLRKCGFFPVNPWRGIGPTVEGLPNELDTEFLDVRICIPEKPFNWLKFGAAHVVEAAVLGGVDDVYRAGVWLFDAGRRHLGEQPRDE